MAKGALTDYMGFADTNIKLTNSSENRSIQTAEAADERGDNIARETFEDISAPSCDYSVCVDYDMATISLGALIDGTAEPDVITTGFTVTTTNSALPTISVSGDSVPTGSVESYTYTTPAQTLLKAIGAQILFGSFVLTGSEGNYLEACSATGTATLNRALDENGETCAWDVNAGQIEVTAEIIQSAATVPTVTPAVGWVTTSTLSATDENTGYQKHTITMRNTPAAVAPTP